MHDGKVITGPKAQSGEPTAPKPTFMGDGHTAMDLSDTKIRKTSEIIITDSNGNRFTVSPQKLTG